MVFTRFFSCHKFRFSKIITNNYDAVIYCF